MVSSCRAAFHFPGVKVRETLLAVLAPAPYLLLQTTNAGQITNHSGQPEPGLGARDGGQGQGSGLGAKDREGILWRGFPTGFASFMTC